MPTKIGKRLVVLDHVAQAFPMGHTWPEAEVSATLRRFHPDLAMLRRYLVEEGFTRPAGRVLLASGRQHRRLGVART